MNRPVLHVTPQAGWLNDPHGICWTGDQYHLFYQHNPAGPRWDWAISWGHATSPDLVHWQHAPIALSPRPGEGCFSGDTIVEGGRPTIVYTRVSAENLDLGAIAIALPDDTSTTWAPRDDAVVIAGPPAESNIVAFRDPCITQTPEGWRMVVGAGDRDGRGLVLQYRSRDARRWEYDGIVCSGPESGSDGVGTGPMWECPHLLQVGADWVLIVSVNTNESPQYVAAAVGDFDGRTFLPRRWGRLTHDDIAYATTSFMDKEGRPCLMSWFREAPGHSPDARPWSGALSVPMTIEVAVDSTVLLLPHPDVEMLRGPLPLLDQELTEMPLAVAVGGAVEVVISLAKGSWCSVELASGDSPILTLSRLSGALAVSVSRGDDVLGEVPLASATIRAIVDAGLLEVFAGDGCAAFRFHESISELRMAGSPETGAVVYHMASAVVPPVQLGTNVEGPRR